MNLRMARITESDKIPYVVIRSVAVNVVYD